jgi:integrase
LAALPHTEISSFMAELRRQEGIAARALEFAVLAAARAKEVRFAAWQELDLAEKVWTVPAERMKEGVLHRVPLAGRPIEILEQMQVVRQGELVFPGSKHGRPIGHSAMLRVLQEVIGRDGLTQHGFRSTFRDWAAECTSFPREVAEQALAHTVSNKAEAAYRRSDLLEKRRQLMAAWDRHCAEITAEVVALAAAR